MSAQTTEAQQLRELLAAVLDAVTLPYGARDYDRRLQDRVGWVRATLDGALQDPEDGDISWNTAFLRGRLAKEQAAADERAANSCRRCGQPFDPAHTSLSGHARHQDTPWCRGCVDRCHDSTDAFHVCPICDPQRYGGDAS